MLDQANINITLTTSLKSLKEQAKAFIDDVNQGLKLIASQQQNNERMLIRFKKSLNAPQAIIEVINEVKSEEELRNAREEKARIDIAVRETENNQEAVINEPIEVNKIINKPIELITVKFTVTGSKMQLISVRNFMQERGIKYE